MSAGWHTTDLHGETRINPDLRQMRAVLDSLKDAADCDFPDVSLTHSSGWAITINQDWIAVLERVPDDGTPPAFLETRGLTAALELWQLLADGKIEAVLARRWLASWE